MSADEPEFVYRFSELSDKAKDHVRERIACWGWDRSSEYLASLKALAEHFGGRLTNWEIEGDWSGGRVQFNMPEIGDLLSDTSETEDEDGYIDEERLEALHRVDVQHRLDRLEDYDSKTLEGRGTCALTGWCYDEYAIDGFRKAFFGGENDLDKLMHAAFRSLRAVAKKDFEYEHSDEGLSDTAEANEWWFDEDGNFADAPDASKGRYSKSRRERTQKATAPHGRCTPGNCVEYARNRRVPRCELGRGPKPGTVKSNESKLGRSRRPGKGRK